MLIHFNATFILVIVCVQMRTSKRRRRNGAIKEIYENNKSRIETHTHKKTYYECAQNKTKQNKGKMNFRTRAAKNDIKWKFCCLS